MNGDVGSPGGRMSLGVCRVSTKDVPTLLGRDEIIIAGGDNAEFGGRRNSHGTMVPQAGGTCLGEGVPVFFAV